MNKKPNCELEFAAGRNCNAVYETGLADSGTTTLLIEAHIYRNI